MAEAPQPLEPTDELPAPSDNPGAPPLDPPSEPTPKAEPTTDPEVPDDKPEEPAPSDDQPVEEDTAKDDSTQTPSKENNDESDKKEKEKEEPLKENVEDKDQQTSNDKPQENGDGDGDEENKEEPQQEEQPPEPTEPANDEQPAATKDEPSPKVTDEGVIEISQEEKDIYTQINKEKESITKCIDSMVESMSKFENDEQEKTNLINETFDSLIKSLNDRRNGLINELKDNILTSKSEGLERIKSLKEYQQTLNDMDSKYQSLTNPPKQTKDNDDEKDKPEPMDASQRKEEILSMTKQLDPKHAETEFGATIKLRIDTNDIESLINNIGSIRIGKPGDPEYDEEKVPSIIDTNLEILLAEIPVKKLYRWALKSGDDYTWKSRCQRTVILFYQNKTSYKVRMIVKENESDNLLMNQWVATKELVEKEKLVWLWSSFDATIAKEEGDEKKGYTKWCAKFFDDIAFERFEDQYNQARKINIQVLENEEKVAKQKEKQQKLKKKYEAEISRDEDINDIHDEDAEYYENDEKLCFEMDVWKTYLWSKDASGKGSWKGYADKALLQFFENRNNKKIRIVLREHETKELKLNHWIPTDIALKSRGDQMWEWQVYDDLATKFLKNSTLKLATICGTFIDKKDTTKFKELFEKYQKINQKAEAI